MTLDVVKLTVAVSALVVDNDDHWTKGGLPDLNHICEAMGAKVSRAELNAVGHLKDVTRENPYMQDPNANPDSNEPAAPELYPLNEESPGFAINDRTSDPEPAEEAPKPVTVSEVGAYLIEEMDRLALMLSPEVRSRHAELCEPFQIYAAERPTILEKQKRLVARAEQRAKAGR